MFEGKTYWLVGASEGLGRSLARDLVQAGAQVILSARGTARLEALAAELGNARPLAMDVTDAGSVRAAAESLGEIDGVIYCAGLYEPMTAQNWDTDAALTVADVNYMGALRVLGHVVPAMAARGTGHIAIIGSLAGFTGLPGAIGYGSSKGAVMHLAENLYADLWHTGVKVQLINPGFIKTRLTEKNSFEMPFIVSADEAARRTMTALRSGRFQTSFPWGFSLVFRLGRVLPRALFVRLFARSG